MLQIARIDVQIDRDLVEVDAIDLQKKITSFMQLPYETQHQEIAVLHDATQTFKGEFLAGFHLTGAAEFQQWQLFEQGRFNELFLSALALLQQLYAESGDWRNLIDAATKHLSFVPWEESAHQYLIQAYMAQSPIWIR